MYAKDLPALLVVADMANLDKSRFLRYTVEDTNHYYLGWKTTFQERSFQICGKSCRMDEKDGILRYTYTLADRTFCSVNKAYNPHFHGMSLLGRVLVAEQDNLRIHLDIDESQDPGTAHLWPWVPETGNLMYLMPRKGSRVSVYFGNGEESAGIAVNCIRENNPAPPVAGTVEVLPPVEEAGTFQDGYFNPSHRSLTTEHGKTMYLWPDSIGFSTRDQSGGGPILHSLRILDEKGIQLSSSQSIVMTAGGNIRIKGKKIDVKGQKYAYMGRVEFQSDGSELIPIPKSEIHFRYSNGLGEFEITGEQILSAGWNYQTYPAYNDAPGEREFETGKFVRQIAIGVAIALAIGAITVATGGIGLFAVGSTAAWVFGGMVTVGGLAYVGVTAYNDYQRGGSISSLGTYACAAVRGSGTVLLYGRVGGGISKIAGEGIRRQLVG